VEGEQIRGKAANLVVQVRPDLEGPFEGQWSGTPPGETGFMSLRRKCWAEKGRTRCGREVGQFSSCWRGIRKEGIENKRAKVMFDWTVENSRERGLNA